MIELDFVNAIDTITLAAITKPMRLHAIFLKVAETLPVEKPEVKAALQRLRKASKLRFNIQAGEWQLSR